MRHDVGGAGGPRGSWCMPVWESGRQWMFSAVNHKTSLTFSPPTPTAIVHTSICFVFLRCREHLRKRRETVLGGTNTVDLIGAHPQLRRRHWVLDQHCTNLDPDTYKTMYDLYS